MELPEPVREQAFDLSSVEPGRVTQPGRTSVITAPGQLHHQAMPGGPA
jgi:hypothetical protein